MQAIHKTIVTDEAMRPIAVQIDYADWLQIEQTLELAGSKPSEEPSPVMTPSQFAGTITLKEDPLAFQSRIRGEWQ